jgi:hypothetical protein
VVVGSDLVYRGVMLQNRPMTMLTIKPTAPLRAAAPALACRGKRPGMPAGLIT